MNDKLQELRETMVSSFHKFKAIYAFHIKDREDAWAHYVTAREAFLKADAELKGWKYIPLKETLQTTYVYGSYKLKGAYGCQ
jgi:hypothetical protein